MRDDERKRRTEARLSLGWLNAVPEEDSLWYESPEEIQRGLERGREKAIQHRWVRRIMERRLTERQCEYLELRFFDGLTYSQIGIIMGVTGAAAHHCIQRAIRRLRASVEAGEFPPRTRRPKPPADETEG
ncbi:MAG: hypothetical protein JXR94_05025 [Candidatus Hydrogenedentes bacterium]|nr:hypothetical protein [Candidatus Hydrogenedentota bacterium]